MMFSTLCLSVAMLLAEQPFPKHIGPVKYPLVARLSHTQGVVIAHVSLDSAGKVVSLTTQGYPMLADAVKTWIKDWTFEVKGENTADIMVEFKLVGQSPPWPSNAETVITYDLPKKVTIVTELPECDHCKDKAYK